MGESRERNARHMETIRLRDEYIKLGQALKATGMVESGVEAKEVIQEGLLHRAQGDDLAQVVALGVAFHGADALAVEAAHPVDAGAHALAAAIRPVDHYGAGMADADATAELGTGQVHILVQEVDHHGVVIHFDRANETVVDGHVYAPHLAVFVFGDETKRENRYKQNNCC